jgi:hypothetical protein
MSKSLSVQVNLICLLLFLISWAAIVGHSEWFR